MEEKPHRTSIAREAWRGAVFGAKVTAIGMGSLAVLITLSVSAFAMYRWWLTAESPLVQAGGWFQLVRNVGEMIGGIALASFYGAIVGVIFFAFAAKTRKRDAMSDDHRQ